MTFYPNNTQYVKRTAKVRSRHMIPMECLAFIMLAMVGYSGTFGTSYLNYVLTAEGQALWWGLFILPVALCGWGAAGVEWWLGTRWEGEVLFRSITIRMLLSGLAFFMWFFYILYVMATIEGGPIMSVVYTAFFVCPFHLWSWWVNLRAHCALNPNMRTENLGRRLETSRDRW